MLNLKKKNEKIKIYKDKNSYPSMCFLFMILYECQLNARHLLSLKAHDNEQLFSFGNK